VLDAFRSEGANGTYLISHCAKFVFSRFQGYGGLPRLAALSLANYSLTPPTVSPMLATDFDSQVTDQKSSRSCQSTNLWLTSGKSIKWTFCRGLHFSSRASSFVHFSRCSLARLRPVSLSRSLTYTLRL